MKHKKFFACAIAAVLGTSAMGVGIVRARTSHTVIDLRNMQDFLLGKETPDLSSTDYDLNGDGRWDVFDMVLMRKELVEQSSSKILIVYFTHAENAEVDAVSSATRVTWNDEEMGAAETVAKMIQKQTNADIFSIQTVQKYPFEYSELADFAKAEKDDNVHPELATHIENIDNYDTIFVVLPAWWYTMPMPLYSFFEEYDLSGKTIIPAVTHEGSGLVGSPRTIAELEPDANVVTEGFSVRFGNAGDAEEDVISWLNGLEIS